MPPFWYLGATLAPREHLGWLWRLGSTLGGYLATRNNPGGPWEQKDGHAVAHDRILVDFGMISGLVYVSFSIQNA